MNTEKHLKTFLIKKPLKLDCGKTINNFPIAYETYGSLNEKKDNAILVFHALTGDQFVTGLNPVTISCNSLSTQLVKSNILS